MPAYLKNKDLRKEIIISLEQDELTPKALEYLLLMVERFGHLLYYKNPDDKKDCAAQATMDVYLYWRNYNPKYKNAFAYYTEIIKNGYAKGWRFLHGSSDQKFVSFDNMSFIPF